MKDIFYHVEDLVTIVRCQLTRAIAKTRLSVYATTVNKMAIISEMADQSIRT